MRYFIETNNDIFALSLAVNTHLQNGCTLVGGIAINKTPPPSSHTIYAQALVTAEDK